MVLVILFSMDFIIVTVCVWVSFKIEITAYVGGRVL